MVDQAHIDLLALLGGSYQRVSGRDGGEYAGSCPFCGGRDRFHVWPHAEHPTWWCRQCDKRGDAITLLRERDGLSFQEATRQLGLPDTDPHPRQPRWVRMPDPAVEPPPPDWQAAAWAFVKESAAALWSDYARPREWLHQRGFTDATLRHFQIGYHTGSRQHDQRVNWGLPEEPYTDQRGRQRLRTTIWLPKGIVIPWIADGHLWGVQIRRPKGNPRYYSLPGSGNALFNADALVSGQGVVLVEGAFDAIAVQQEAGHLVAAAATGSGGARAMRWITRIALCAPILLGFDADQGGETPTAYWQAIFPKARRWPPLANDPAAMLQRGLSLHSWAQIGLAKIETMQRTREEVSA